MNTDCWAESYPDLMDAGASASDFFTPAYVNGIGLPSSTFGGGNCMGDTNCTTWLARMTADWPHLTGAAAKTPVLVVYANDDTTITPDVMQCVYNRLSVDQAAYEVCYDPNPVGHSGSVSENADYVADWIAQQATWRAAAHGGMHGARHQRRRRAAADRGCRPRRVRRLAVDAAVGRPAWVTNEERASLHVPGGAPFGPRPRNKARKSRPIPSEGREG